MTDAQDAPDPRTDAEDVAAFLETVHPYDSLPRDELARVAGCFGRRTLPAGAEIYHAGAPLDGLFLIRRGGVEVLDGNGALVSLLSARNSFGERGLMRDGRAATTARTTEETQLLVLPPADFRHLLARSEAFARFFRRGGGSEPRGADLASMKVSDLIARRPLSCAADTPAAEAARIMRDAGVSSLGVTEPLAGGGERLLGIVTVRDLSGRVLAEGRDPGVPVHQVMTADPVTLPSSALGSDILHLMLERGIGHLPIVDQGRFAGMVTQTDLTRFQALSSALLIQDVAEAATVEAMAAVTARIPHLLLQMVGSHVSHEVVTRRITDIADAVTRRLLQMAEAELGPAPVPWLWLACGSQGRQEQTGLSDQDNCMILDDAAGPEHEAYFAAFARFVCDGLDACGYVYCPGEMMAMTPRWRQPLSVWRDYFHGWIARPDPMAQMLASVMFDLRPIGGAARLFAHLQQETLAAAAQNSIFVAHMIANSLKHAPPLGLIRSFATVRSGERRHQIDMKMNGVVPVTDLGRIYALLGRLEPVNTRARLVAAEDAAVISPAGARDLIAAYDLIATMRLENQAALVKSGRRPDNFLAPYDLSDFARSHLRDAFVVVRTMQSALGHGKGAPG
ncbi:DUF294 nucleotidyltransferase-like domain-containing protein [Frigidibacter oleivorans]|uniref:DUF294 nucleotidyltransferase-like domain-containing protein n=1 Tax=Frigidibacter oleivorans TaxID=2487129 RepID=UPI000F8CF995|nr:DUF294 nucleotidyltransferase-like domain-containing protein [Frigidibacter oleivorans]